MTASQKTPGTLFIVATPIGHLADFSLRGINTLEEVDLILAEDTRHAGILLAHHQITTRTRSFHEHNERAQVESVVGELMTGKNLALISDAGTPLISDPGYRLVQECVSRAIPVCPVPGASAILSALSVSGLATDRFCFEGFLPSRDSARNQRLAVLEKESRTMVFYESSHRILASIESMARCFGDDRTACAGREMTKKFESFYYGSLADVLAQLTADPVNQKGEFVVVVSGAQLEENPGFEQAKELVRELMEHLPLKQACAIAARTFDCNKNRLYQAGLELKKSRQESPEAI